MGDVGVVVFVHRDFFEHDAALGFDIGRIDPASGDHLADHINGQRHVVGEHPCVVARAFFCGECVEVATDLFNCCGNLERATRRCSLEE